jgi:GT2 family glycosyltransferase
MSDQKFAAFIMTYERPQILLDTISKILEQTLPPEKILVVDNSESFETQQLVESLADSRIVYYRVGYNAGPAGAAKIGLQILAEEDYQWIYWGDDDDPPKSQECFEKLLLNIDSERKPGIIGAVGHKLNQNSMVIQRTSDSKLKNSKWIEVDVIAGGMCMIVNGEVVRKGVLPDENLFYGFEELDFCLQVKKAGFYIYVLSELFEYYRQHSKRPIERAGKRGLKKSISSLWREYYSTRNMLKIARKNKLIAGEAFATFRSLLKLFYCFRFGVEYGKKNAQCIMMGCVDFYRGKNGKRSFS